MSIPKEIPPKLIALIRSHSENISGLMPLIDGRLESVPTVRMFGPSNTAGTLSLYQIRYANAREGLSDETAVGWDDLIRRFRDYSGKDVLITSVQYEQSSFLLFTDSEYSSFIGFLKSGHEASCRPDPASNTLDDGSA